MPDPDMFDLMSFHEGEVIAVKEDDEPTYFLATVLSLQDDSMTVHYFATRNSELTKAVFYHAYIDRAGTITLTLKPTTRRGLRPWTGNILADELDDIVIARRLDFKRNYHLSRQSAAKLKNVKLRHAVV